jgi:pimeloyl-ACP methyl ester carboxylesterase
MVAAGGDDENISDLQLLVIIAIAIVLIGFGTVLASWTTTAGGDVSLDTATVESESGLDLAATVYKPDTASESEPAPAVVLYHGYTGNQDTMASYATEFADRGYVAITIDQPGHGASDPPAFADSWGGPAGLDYARSLSTVDEERIALVGHSMGGFAALAAAKDQPDGYEALVLLGSSWGPMEAGDGVPHANESFPRNLAVIYSPYDEFGTQMWGEHGPDTIHQGEKLAGAFGTNPPVQPRRTYGSIDDGTARVYTAPNVVHTRMHLSKASIADTLAWVSESTAGPADPETERQRWQWAKLGHVLALVGGIVVAFATTGLVWRTLQARRDGTVEEEMTDGGTAEEEKADWETADESGQEGETNRVRSRTLLVGFSAIPALTIYPLYLLGITVVPVTPVTPQELTHGYVVWGLGTVVIAGGVLGLVERRATSGENADSAGKGRFMPLDSLQERGRQTWGHALAAGIAGIAVLYIIVAILSLIPGSGFAAWMAGLHTLTPVRWFTGLLYVIPVTICTIALAFGLRKLVSMRGFADILWSVGQMCGGLLAFLAIQYIPLLLGFGLPVPALGPLAIQTIRATMLLSIATGLIAANTLVTDEPLPGGVAAGLLVTWLLVGTEPIHVVPF